MNVEENEKVYKDRIKCRVLIFTHTSKVRCVMLYSGQLIGSNLDFFLYFIKFFNLYFLY